MPTHSEKIENALVAYLAAQTFPSLGKPKRIFPGEDDEEKTDQCVLCIMDDMQEEFPEQSGNRYSMCRVELRTPVSEDKDDHVAAAVLLEEYLMDSALVASLTSAVADFTVMGVLDRQPIQEQTENYWMNGFTFRLYSCPRAFS